jgi:hypothetical protein
MAILEFVLPEGSPEPCPNACGGLTEDPYGGPCQNCWRDVPRVGERVDLVWSPTEEPPGGDP